MLSEILWINAWSAQMSRHIVYKIFNQNLDVFF